MKKIFQYLVISFCVISSNIHAASLFESIDASAKRTGSWWKVKTIDLADGDRDKALQDYEALVQQYTTLGFIKVRISKLHTYVKVTQRLSSEREDSYCCESSDRSIADRREIIKDFLDGLVEIQKRNKHFEVSRVNQSTETEDSSRKRSRSPSWNGSDSLELRE